MVPDDPSNWVQSQGFGPPPVGSKPPFHPRPMRLAPSFRRDDLADETHSFEVPLCCVLISTSLRPSSVIFSHLPSSALVNRHTVPYLPVRGLRFPQGYLRPLASWALRLLHCANEMYQSPESHTVTQWMKVRAL